MSGTAKTERRWWGISFSENGEEYYGSLAIKARAVKLIDKKTLLADGVEIQIDEYFIGEPE